MNNSIALADNEYVIAAKNTQYKDMDQRTRTKEIADLVGKAFKFRGQESNMADNADIAISLDAKIISCYPMATIPEIKTAFEYGITGEYGEYYGINFVTLFKFIKSYMEKQERLDALNAYRKATVKALPAPKWVPKTPEQLKAQANNDLKDFFNQVHENGSISASLHTQEWLYNYLRKANALPQPSEEMQQNAMNEARAFLDYHSKNHYKTIFDIIDDARDEQDKTTDRQKLVRKAKAILLKDFIRNLKSPIVID